MKEDSMSLQSTEKQRIRTTLICGKCGSKAIVSENGNNDSNPQRIRALKCLICGNRQEQGAPCRWPFFLLKIDPMLSRCYITFLLYHVKEPVQIVKISPSRSMAALFCPYDRLMSVSGAGSTPPPVRSRPSFTWL